MFISQIEAEINSFNGGDDSTLDATVSSASNYPAGAPTIAFPAWLLLLRFNARAQDNSRLMRNRVADTKTLIKETN